MDPLNENSVYTVTEDINENCASLLKGPSFQPGQAREKWLRKRTSGACLGCVFGVRVWDACLGCVFGMRVWGACLRCVFTVRVCVPERTRVCVT